MDRKALIRKNLNLNGIGLEIGPSDNPVCAKREGYHVEILDCNSKEEKLRTKHMEDRAMEFEDVDYVWKGERYATNRHSLGAFLDAALNSVLFETKDQSNISTMPYFAGLMSESSFQYGRYIPVLDEIMSGYSKEKEYRNCHSWVFTPASFQILIYKLNLLGYIDLFY